MSWSNQGETYGGARATGTTLASATGNAGDSVLFICLSSTYPVTSVTRSVSNQSDGFLAGHAYSLNPPGNITAVTIIVRADSAAACTLTTGGGTSTSLWALWSTRWSPSSGEFMDTITASGWRAPAGASDYINSLTCANDNALVIGTVCDRDSLALVTASDWTEYTEFFDLKIYGYSTSQYHVHSGYLLRDAGAVPQDTITLSAVCDIFISFAYAMYEVPRVRRIFIT
jgi:hypothetical protein